jgi:hypothetical protein
MTLLSLFALVLPAALIAPKATKRETQLAEQREREIQLNKRLQTARLETLETECAARGETRLGGRPSACRRLNKRWLSSQYPQLPPSRCPATGGFARRRGRRL